MSEEKLSCMILQAASSNGSISREAATFNEVWKGPWDEIKKITQTSKIFNTTLIIGGKRPEFTSSKWKFEYDIPTTASQTKFPWVIRDINISEGIGNSGFLTLNYYATANVITGYDPDNGELPAEETESQIQLSSYERSQSQTWQVSWQPYNRSPLEYSQIPDEIIKLKNYPASEEWTYYDNAANTSICEFSSSEKEKKLANDYIKDIAPQFHYPIVTCHQEYLMPDKPFTDEIAKDLDTIQELPNQCPFKNNLTAWEWIKTGDVGSIRKDQKQTIKSTTTEPIVEDQLIYIRDTTWQGAKKWDEKYYGQNAWQPVED